MVNRFVVYAVFRNFPSKVNHQFYFTLEDARGKMILEGENKHTFSLQEQYFSYEHLDFWEVVFPIAGIYTIKV